MPVKISGMFGSGKTYFADAPVIIDIAGLEWPETSPFTVVIVEVIYNSKVVGRFYQDVGKETDVHLDISSALRAIWSDYDFEASGNEVMAATAALYDNGVHSSSRTRRSYSLQIHTEYLNNTDGEFTTTSFGPFAGGQCLMGDMTEWERSLIADDTQFDVSALEHTGVRYGDASTKPASSLERVGKNSITSWVDVNVTGTMSLFYPATYNNGQGEDDDVKDGASGWTGHAPIVLRDSQPYVDFLFVNRRGAVETCSGLMLENMNINVSSQQYSRVERPSFRPSRSLMNIRQGGPRRAWDMSSGFVDREWAEWWAMEFLQARQWWMRYPIGDATGAYVPVVVAPAKKSVGIYDRSKQTMPHVDFTVTLGLEG